MAMTPSAMANAIKSAINKIDKPDQAINKFYKALCDYVESNAQVIYAWVGIQPGTPPVPDPLIVINATIKTSGSISLSNATDPSSACSMFSQALNTAAATWMIQFPADFSLSPCFIIPTINITPSNINNRDAAWLVVCTQIIAGIKLATPTALGSHGSFTAPPGSGATFTSIL